MASANAPLSPQHLQELELARLRGKKIRRAIGVAQFSGWTTAFFAAITLLFGLFSFTALLLGAALAVVAYNELAGAKLLRNLDERATRRLGFNQLGFCGVLITYALWSIYSSMTGPSPFGGVLDGDQQVNAMLGSFEDLHTLVTLGVYGGLIVGSLIFQGGAAWYYFSRGRHLRDYIRETPPWVIDLQQTTGTL